MVRSQPPPPLTVSRLARSAGVGVETVRYYQRLGLLPRPARGSGIHHYGPGDLQCLRFIRSAKEAGFTLAEIGELLALDAFRDRGRVLALSQQRVAELDAEIARLQRARGALQRLTEQCASGGAGPCPILDAFENQPAAAGEGRADPGADSETRAPEDR